VSRFRRAFLLFLALGAVAAFGASSASAAPTVNATCDPGPGCARWYSGNVVLTFSVTGATNVLSGCTAAETLSADGDYTRECIVSDGTDIVGKTVHIGIDRTPPVVTGAVASRQPNADGWINGPFDVQFTGSDAVSGLSACWASYAGPQTATGSITRVCTDQADNASAPYTFSFKFDATPPALSPLTIEPGDGMVRLRWSTRDAVEVEVTRSPGLSGAPVSAVFRGKATGFVDRRVRNLASYQYQVTAIDRAGNLATQTTRTSPARRILTPLNNARLTAPPVARWAVIPNATYYNLQLYRGNRKILSAWPKTARLPLKRQWTFQGARYRLKPGVYQLFVWPGFGSFAEQRYGRIVGKGRFVITKSP
jgi:hypothetical protein